jgi:hypothetical protein
VLYAALRPGSCTPLVGLSRNVRAAFFRRWIELRRFFEFGRFPRRLLRWIQFGKFLVERALEQSRFHRVVFSQLRRDNGRTT